MDHIGRTGKDGGVDIHGTEIVASGTKVWMIQCKRQVRVSASELKKMVDKIILNYSIPDKVLLIVSCDLSKKSRDTIAEYCKHLRIPELEIWTSTNLETLIYANQKVLSIALGLNKEKETKANIQKINRGLKMEWHKCTHLTYLSKYEGFH